MNETKKRNIVIGALCGVLLLMVVGYAAFNTLLNIEGTASISSNWDIKITNIEESTKVGEASSAIDPTFKDLTATFNTNLVSPGDSIEYDVTVNNHGNLNAELARIKISENDNEAIKFTTSGIKEGDILEASSSAVLTVKVEYDSNVTSQPDNLTANLTVTLDYVEAGHKSEWIPSDAVNIGGQYVDIVDGGKDGLYADETEDERYVYKGANPNNYITFNDEEAGWRIVSVESDGTIKIIHQGNVSSAGEMKFDTNGKRNTGYCSKGKAPTWGCNAWAQTTNFHDALNQYSGAVDKDSEMKTYLNGTYYNSITKNKSAIKNHIFYYGGAEHNNDNLTNQIKTEKEFSVESNVGLIQASDYIKANTNTSLCGTYKKNNSNYSTCKSTNYMVNWMGSSGNYWMITPGSNPSNDYNMSNVLYMNYIGIINNNNANNSRGIVPSLYLKSDIELEGEGTEENPYTIKNYE